MITDPDGQAAVDHGEGAGDSRDDVMRSAQILEHRDGGGGDDNTATGIGLQVLKQRKRARSLPIDTTTCTLGIPYPDSGHLLEDPHLAKRQRLYLRTGDESESMHISTPNPISSRSSKAGTGGTHSRMDDGCHGCPGSDNGNRPHKSAVGAVGGAALVGMEKGEEAVEVDISSIPRQV